MKRTLTVENVSEHCSLRGWWMIAPVHKQEQEWVEKLAKERNANGKRNGWKSKTDDESDKWHKSGAAAEWAVSLMFNLPVRATDSKGAGQIHLPDIGGFIEVKSSIGNTSDRWNLCVNEDQLDRAHEATVYVQVLTCLYPQAVVIIGAASRKRVLSEGQVRTHSVNGHKFRLLPWEELARPDVILKTDIWHQDVYTFRRQARVSQA